MDLMALIETKDAALVCKIIESESKNAGIILSNLPTYGAVDASIREGDLCFIDDKEPRIVGWCHPLSKTEVAVLHLWGPSGQWKALFQAATDFLLSHGFVTAKWVEGNPLSNSASQMTAATKVGSETSVSLAQAKISLTTVV